MTLTDDELDAQLRGAMKVLDGEVPSGYFDASPSEVLSRLEVQSMDTTPTPTPTPRTNDLPVTAAREEDSGLHDIKSLAQSTKQRLSKKITVPPVSDDDLIASSSAGWKAVALPEPAKMISLPELAELPSKKIIKEQAKAEKKAAVVAAPAVVADSPKPVAAVEKPAIGAHLASQPKSKTPLYAAIGVGLAAAAGGLIYIATSGGSKSEPAPVVAKNDTAPVAAAPKPAPVPTATPIEPPPAPPAPVEEPVVAPPPVETAPVAAVSKKPAAKTKGADVHKVEITEKTAAPAGKPAAAPAEKKIEKPAGKEGEPSFDDLLKEAGVKDGPKAVKPTLEKKSLSGGDFKSGMAGIAGKAQACYAGTQGTAAVKLTIGNDGHVTKASVTGPFAGTPVAACVESAVRGATFPAWDGGPQSFGYSFLLSE